jgi:hypothetical protein
MYINQLLTTHFMSSFGMGKNRAVQNLEGNLPLKHCVITAKIISLPKSL